MLLSLICLPSRLATQSLSKFSKKIRKHEINDSVESDVRSYFNDMSQTRALEHMKRMIQPLRQPRAQNCDLLRVPLLKKVQNPKIVVDFASNQIDVVASEVHVALSELFTWPRNVLKENDWESLKGVWALSVS